MGRKCIGLKSLKVTFRHVRAKNREIESRSHKHELPLSGLQLNLALSQTGFFRYQLRMLKRAPYHCTSSGDVNNINCGVSRGALSKGVVT